MTPSQLKELTLIQKGINRLTKRLRKVHAEVKTEIGSTPESRKLYYMAQDLGSVSGQIGNIIENNEG